MLRAVRQLLEIAGILLAAGGAGAVSEGTPPFAPPGAAGPVNPLFTAPDPIHVFYPRGHCDGSHLELEVWERESHSWTPHPRHARVPVETCQVEDAGRLLNELRWRCADPFGDGPWNVGLDVFDPGITQSCAVGELRAQDYSIDIHVSAPARSLVVSSPDRKAKLRGSVRIDGIEGTAYDVLLMLDRSRREGERRLAEQLRAATGFIEALRPRLGPVRIGLASYPNPNPAAGESHKGRLELPLTGDADLLLRTLKRIGDRGAAGEPAFADGLESGLHNLLLLSDGQDRPAARRVLVLASDGRSDPFVGGEAPDPVLVMRLDNLAEDARRSGIRLHVLALGGYAEEPTALVKDLVARSFGRFLRIRASELDTPFFSRVALPEPVEVRVTSPVTGARRSARVDRSGHFTLEVPLASGTNSLRLEAITSDQRSEKRDWVVEYDDRQYLQLVLEAERRRISREQGRQRKALDVRAEPLPSVGAGPP